MHSTTCRSLPAESARSRACSRLERLTYLKHCRRGQGPLIALHVCSMNIRRSTGDSSINRSGTSRRLLNIQAKAHPQEDKRYPHGIQDVGFSLLRAPKLMLTDAERMRLDESPDMAFYSPPRLMQHVSADFISTLQGVYSNPLPPGASVLELCASRYSHLPPNLQLVLLVGQGMNTAELSENPDLTRWFVQDLNQQPLLLEQLDASYDAVLCVNGIQYLTQPETVITEVWRVLRPGGSLFIAFGEHFSSEKAIAGWICRNMQQRTTLVSQMLKANGFDQVLVMDQVAAQVNGSSASDNACCSTAGQVGSPADGSDADVGAAAPTVHIQVLVATKSCLPVFSGAAAATASIGGNPGMAGAPDMRPDNVAAWFTKPGLAGLAASLSGVALGSAPGNPVCLTQQGAAGTHAENGIHHASADARGAVYQSAGAPVDISGACSYGRLIEQWRASYGVLVSDAVALGIPASVIPQLKSDASPADVQEAVQHLQAMVASFLSSGL